MLGVGKEGSLLPALGEVPDSSDLSKGLGEIGTETWC